MNSALEGPGFVRGRDLCEGFFRELVQPRLDALSPPAYAAGLWGTGSEVLGFDTERSTDHHWGPRVVILTRDEDRAWWSVARDELSRTLPKTYRGWSTHWGAPDAIGVRLLKPARDGEPIDHRVEFDSLAGFLESSTGWDGRREPSLAQWLTTPEQLWRALAVGPVFHDEIGFVEVRRGAAWYPEAVLRSLLACQWHAIAQELPFLARCIELDDDLGSRIIAARLVHGAMRVAFWTEGQFPPYSKWWGTAFRTLAIAGALERCLARTWESRNPSDRLDALNDVLGRLIVALEELGWLKDRDPAPVPFHGRPGLIAPAEAVANELAETLPEGLRRCLWMGSIDVMTTSTDVLTNREARSRLAALLLSLTES